MGWARAGTTGIAQEIKVDCYKIGAVGISLETPESVTPEELAVLSRKYCVHISYKDSDGYNTTRVVRITQQLIENNVPIMNMKSTLKLLFERDFVPLSAKKSIKQITFFPKVSQVVVQSDDYIGRNELFSISENLSLRTGWYFYITGSELPEPEIKAIVDEQLSHREEPEIEVSENTSPIILSNLDTSDEVEGISLVLEIGKNRILLDAGTIRSGDSLPLIIDFSFAVISHAHKDHTNLITSSQVKSDEDLCPLVMTKPTLYLLANSVWESKRSQSEKIQLIKSIVKKAIIRNYGELLLIEPIKLTFYNAGHLLGSAISLIQVKAFNFAYTGDFNLWDTAILDGAFGGKEDSLPGVCELSKVKPLNALAIESTYGDIIVQKYSIVFNEFFKLIDETLLKQKVAVIASEPIGFAVWLYQTLIVHLNPRMNKNLDPRLGMIKTPLYLEREAYGSMRIHRACPEFLNRKVYHNIQSEHDPFASASLRIVRGLEDVKYTLAKDFGSIFISHYPDLTRGPICALLPLVSEDPDNLLILTGSLKKRDSPANLLVSGKRYVKIGNRDTCFNMRIKSFSASTRMLSQLWLSDHVDQKQISDTIKLLNPREIVFFHGSAKSREEWTKIFTSEGRIVRRFNENLLGH